MIACILWVGGTTKCVYAKRSQVDFNTKTKTTHYNYIIHIQTSPGDIELAADIAYWPATPRMKSMRPAIAERLDNPELGDAELERLVHG